MSTFHLSIITAKGKAFTGEAESVMLPGTRGSFGILAHHTPLIGALSTGLAKVTTEGQELFFLVGNGYVEVARNQVSVLVGEAARVKDKFTGLDLLKKEDPWKAVAELEEAG